MFKKNRIIVLAVFVLYFFVSISSALVAGTRDHEKENGGDGVYVNGELVLRDFLDSTNLITDNKEFLDSTPEFIDLIVDISKVYPEFALLVWGNLLDAKIWLTNKELDILPKEVTTVAGDGPDEQVAIRDSEDIVISLPAFNKVNRGYLLLHEALQGILRGNGRFKHARVRKLVSYFKENRNSYKREDIKNLFSKLDLHMNVFYYDSLRILEGKYETLSLLISETGSFEARCSIIKLLKEGYLINTLDNLSYLENWSNYNTCEVEDSLELLNQNYPKIYNIVKNPTDSTYISAIYQINPPAKVSRYEWFSESFDYTLYKGQCQRYASKEEYNYNIKWEKKLAKLKEAVAIALNISDNEDKAFSAYFEIILFEFKSYLSEKRVNKIAAELKESWENYYKNVKDCTRLGFLEKK